MPVSRAKLNALVKTAFTSLGDIPITLTYTFVTPGTYDPVTDTMTNTTTTVNDVPAANAKLKAQEIDWFPADLNTQKLLVAAVDLPQVPQIDDYVTIASVRWEVKRVGRVPGDSLFILYVQEP